MPFVKGQVLTHKRTGRKRGAAGMAREIQKRTNNGKALVDFAMEIFEDKEDKYFLHQRQWAASFLADRGFGKPIATLELEGMLAGPPQQQSSKFDLSRLTDKQRGQLREMMQRMRGDPREVATTPSGNIIRLLDGDAVPMAAGGDEE